MKRNMNRTLIFIGIALFIGIAGGILINKYQTTKDINQQEENVFNFRGNGNGRHGLNNQQNRNNCISDDCLLVNDLEYPAGELSEEVQSALETAINDEYKALSTYEAVIAKFGMVRPFSMIKSAEEQHIASLKAIFYKYDLRVPENTWATKVTAPNTLKEACQTGVDAEISNASLYKDKLLPTVKEYEDITIVFTNLMNASQEKHLPAFERCN